MKLRYITPLAIIAAASAAIGLAPIASADAHRAAERGQCPTHCYSRAGRATRRPTAAALRRGYGRAAISPLSPLTTAMRLGPESTSRRPKRYGLGAEGKPGTRAAATQ